MRAQVNGREIVTVDEASQITKLTPWWLRKLARDGKVTATHHRGRWWYDVPSLIAYANLAPNTMPTSDNGNDKPNISSLAGI